MIRKVTVFDTSDGLSELDAVLKGQIVEWVEKDSDRDVGDIAYVVIAFGVSNNAARRVARMLASRVGYVDSVFMGNQSCYIVHY